MSPELVVLALTGLLAGAQFALVSIPANRQFGPAYTLGPRDKPRQIKGVGGRMDRALRNLLDALPLFTAAVLVVELSDADGAFTAFCAWIFLLARILYVPAYALGWAPWRSVIWAVASTATMAMFLTALLVSLFTG